MREWRAVEGEVDSGRSPQVLAVLSLDPPLPVTKVCSIAAASKAVLAVCASCDSAYHLGCVEPALTRVPLHDWFCGDCAKVGGRLNGKNGCAGGWGACWRSCCD